MRVEFGERSNPLTLLSLFSIWWIQVFILTANAKGQVLSSWSWLCCDISRWLLCSFEMYSLRVYLMTGYLTSDCWRYCSRLLSSLANILHVNELSTENKNGLRREKKISPIDTRSCPGGCSVAATGLLAHWMSHKVTVTMDRKSVLRS